MNSMAEMHEEIAEHDQSEHTRHATKPTLEAELRALELQTEALQTQMRRMRKKIATGSTNS